MGRNYEKNKYGKLINYWKNVKISEIINFLKNREKGQKLRKLAFFSIFSQKNFCRIITNGGKTLEETRKIFDLGLCWRTLSFSKRNFPYIGFRIGFSLDSPMSQIFLEK